MGGAEGIAGTHQALLLVAIDLGQHWLWHCCSVAVGEEEGRRLSDLGLGLVTAGEGLVVVVLVSLILTMVMAGIAGCGRRRGRCWARARGGIRHGGIGLGMTGFHIGGDGRKEGRREREKRKRDERKEKKEEEL